MANGSFKIKKSLNIEPISSPTLDQDGDIAVDSSTNKLKARLNSTTEVVTTDAGTSTLTNKTIDADSNTITNIENADIKAAAAIDATKIADGSVSSTEFQYINTLTSNAQTQISSKITAGTAAIVNADVNASAAIERSKLANGTANHVLINDGSGVMSSEAALDETRGGTGLTSLTTGDLPYASASNVFSKLAIGTSNQILTVSGGIPAWAAAPAGGINYMSANNNAETDATSWTTYNDDAGAQTATAVNTTTEALTCASHGLVVGDVIYFSAIGSLTGISTNTRYYIASTADADTFTVALTRGGTNIDLGGTIATTTFRKISFVNGDAGSVSGSDFTWTRSTSSPLRGTGEFLFTKLTNATAAGNGIGFAFTPDRADRNSVLTYSFDMEVSSGTLADNDLEIWIYDVTNSVAIQPTPFYIKTVVAGTNVKVTGQFQTSSSTSYRFCIHNVNPTTTGFVVKLDNFTLSPSYLPQGTPITDWKDAGVTIIGATTTAPTKATTREIDNMKWRRVGSNMEIMWNYAASSSAGAAAGSGDYLIQIPTGYSIDTSIVTTHTTVEGDGLISTNRSCVGYGHMSHGTETGNVIASVYSTTQVRFFKCVSGAGSVQYIAAFESAASSLTIAGLTYNMFMSVPILGWSSNAVMSSDADTRVVAARYTASAAGNPNGAQINFDTKDYDTHGAVTTGASWKFTAPIPGVYQINVTLQAGTNVTVGVHKNGTIHQYLSDTGASSTKSSSCNINLVAGDYIDFRSGGSSTYTSSTTQNHVEIYRLSGPAQIMASETVAASYYETSAHTTTTSTPINFDTKIVDTHGAVTTGSGWRFTAPMAGVYQINVTSRQASTSGGCRVYKNGSFSPPISLFSWQANVTVSGSCIVSMIAGDYVDIRGSASVTTSSDFATDPGVISIVRVSR